MPFGTTPLQQQEHYLSSPIATPDASTDHGECAPRYLGGVRAKLLTGRMLGVHAAAVLGMGVCGLLGRWQWDRAAVTHAAQNGFYAFEWWSFAVILLVVWIRTMQDELRPTPHPDAPGVGTHASPASAAAAALDAEEDEEMTAYNGYLTWLAAHPRD